MLKFIYKTLLISLLSCSLMMLDFNSKGMMINSSYAESVKTDKIKDSDLMGTLTMTAVGTLASRLYTYKPTVDIMLAAAGGAIFIAGEVLAFLKLKDVMKGMEQQIQRDQQGNVNREQQASLERLKQSYVEARKTAQTKKTLQMAAAAAFAAAGVMAYTSVGAETAALTACTSAITSVATTAASQAAACSVSGCSAPFIACVNAANAAGSGMMPYELARQAIGPSTATYAAYQTSQKTVDGLLTTASSACGSSGGTAMSTACKAKFAVDEKGASVGTPSVATFKRSSPLKLIHLNSSEKLISSQSLETQDYFNKYFNVGLNLFFPKAEAALFSAMGIASSAAVAYILFTQKTLAVELDLFMLNPKNRAIVWGVLAGLTFAATSATDNVISQIDANIAKIDAILNGFNALASATPTANGNRITNPNASSATKPGVNFRMNPTKYDDVDLSTLEGGALPCYTGAETKNCKPFEDVAKNLPTYTSLDLPTQSQVAGILKTANGVNGASKISGTTMDGLSRLAASANALKATSDKAKTKLQDKLKIAKSKTNLDAESKKLEDRVNGIVKTSLVKSNSTPSEMYSSMYGVGSAAGDAKATAKAEDTTANKAAPAVANVIDIGAVANVDPANAGMDGIDTGSGKEATMTPEELAAYNEAAKKSNLDGFDVPTSEITNDTSASIFDLISNRYQQSGYPRLFKIKEPVPVKK